MSCSAEFNRWTCNEEGPPSSSSPRHKPAAPAAHPRRTRLGAHLLDQIDDAYRYHVKIARFSGVRYADGTTAVFVRTVDEAGTQSIIPGSFQIANVGRAHHHFLWL